MRVGETIAGYEIVAKLKPGGMASLYLGKRERAGGFAKQAAIKVVHDHLADNEDFVTMFLDEARLTAQIEHPNVVTVHDLGEADGRYFLIMEYVPGCSLAQLQRKLAKMRRRLSPEAACWIAAQIAAGLHAAHEAMDDAGTPLGVVHRDVSPKNVLLAYRGYVKVIDFGIAKAGGRSTHTATGLVKGTFRYMAPEQARGLDIDSRVDVYALGICLWEMLTGRRLFDADNDLRLLDMVRSPEVPLPSTFARVPAELDAVVMNALSVNPETRYPSADAFRSALARAMPSALGMTARQMGELVSVAMGDPEVKGADPSVISMLGKPMAVEEPTSVLKRLTVDPTLAPAVIDGSAALKVDPVPVTVTPSSPTGSGIVESSSSAAFDDAPTLFTPSTPFAQAPAPVEVIDSGAFSAAAEVPVAVTPTAPRRGLFVGIAVACGLLVGGGAVAVMSSAEPEPVTSPLPPRPETSALEIPVDPPEPIETEPDEQETAAVDPIVEPTMEAVVEEPVEPDPVEVAAAPMTMTGRRGRRTPRVTRMETDAMTGRVTQRPPRMTPRMRAGTTMTDSPVIVGADDVF